MLARSFATLFFLAGSPALVSAQCIDRQFCANHLPLNFPSTDDSVLSDAMTVDGWNVAAGFASGPTGPGTALTPRPVGIVFEGYGTPTEAPFALTPAQPIDANLGQVRSIALSGGFAAVGAPPETLDSSGAVFVFERFGSGWEPSDVILGSDLAPGARIGRYVALNDGWLAIPDSLSPRIFILQPQGSGWNVVDVLRTPGDSGGAVDFDGSRLAAADRSSAINQTPAWLHVYDFSAGTAELEGETLLDDAPFGSDVEVALSGRFAFLASGLSDSLVVFERGTQPLWQPVATLPHPGGQESAFRVGLDASGARLVLTLPGLSGLSGAIQTYVRGANGWQAAETLPDTVSAARMTAAFHPSGLLVSSSSGLACGSFSGSSNPNYGGAITQWTLETCAVSVDSAPSETIPVLPLSDSTTSSPVTFEVLGTGLINISEVIINGQSVEFTPFDLETLRVSPFNFPDNTSAPLSVGASPVELRTLNGDSIFTEVQVDYATNPVLRSKYELNTGPQVDVHSVPGHSVALFASGSQAHSIIPGVLSLKLGANFSSLFLASTQVVTDTEFGRIDFDLDFFAWPVGFAYLQAVDLTPSQPGPLPTSNSVGVLTLQ